jgi:Domain of unknown function (DUF4145)
MKCPHCLENFHDGQTWWSVILGSDEDGFWLLTRRCCPSCNHFIFELEAGSLNPALPQGNQNTRLSYTRRRVQVWPKGAARTPIPPEVPTGIAEDYGESCLVLADSPKASAALSRRCLQNVLRSAASVKHGDLANEIDQVIATKTLPSATAESLDHVRVIGNFGAHPMKSTTTGEIVDVEPHEAEWNLDVLETLFDFYYVLPARAKAKKDAINKKLVEAGKPPLP